MENIPGYEKIVRGTKQGVEIRHRFEPLTEEQEAELGVDVDFENLVEKRDNLKESMFSNDHVTVLVSRLFEKIYEEARGVQDDTSLSQEDYESIKEKVDHELAEILKQTINRIKNETSFNDELEDIIDLSHLADIRKFIEEREDVTILDKPKKGAKARYQPFWGKTQIYLGASSSLPEEVLKNLGQDGVHTDFGSLYHEFLHKEQHPQKAYQLDVLKYASLGLVLFLGGEALANIPQTEWSQIPITLLIASSGIKMVQEKKDSSLVGELQSHKAQTELSHEYISNTTIDLLYHLAKHYKFKSKKQRDQIIVGSQQIDRLRALGVSQKDIAKIIQTSKWDHKKHEYDTLQSEIESLAEDNNLSLEQIDSLADARRIEKEIAILEMRHITQEEIKRACQERQVDTELSRESIIDNVIVATAPNNPANLMVMDLAEKLGIQTLDMTDSLSPEGKSLQFPKDKKEIWIIGLPDVGISSSNLPGDKKVFELDSTPKLEDREPPSGLEQFLVMAEVKPKELEDLGYDYETLAVLGILCEQGVEALKNVKVTNEDIGQKVIQLFKDLETRIEQTEKAA